MLRALIIGIGLAATPAAAQFYTDEELAGTRARAVPSILRVMEEDVIGNLPRELRPAAAQVSMAFPDRGPDPLSFYAQPLTQTITMPLESIRFFDDVATLFSWVESKKCQQGYVHSYLWALLRQGRDLPSPLRAFGIDRDEAFADPYTYDVSGKIVSSGLQFILAHELGHLLLDHQGGLTGPSSQTQEIAADAFALDHFARLGGLPMGAFWYYVVAWWRDPVGVEAEARSTHPVSPDRIVQFADRVSNDPMSFSHGELDPEREAAIAADLAVMIANLAGMIDDDGMLTLMPETLDRDYPLSRIHGSCPG